MLAVDDSPSIRQLVALALTGAGLRVIEAADGIEALEKIRSHHVDLVLTDQNMPRMDGLTLIGHLRQLPDHLATPILVLTTESSPAMKRQAKMAGASGWMVKPLDPRKLVEMVSTLTG